MIAVSWSEEIRDYILSSDIISIGVSSVRSFLFLLLEVCFFLQLIFLFRENESLESLSEIFGVGCDSND